MALDIDVARIDAAVGVRLYDFGIAALSPRLLVQNLSWSRFTRLVNRTDQAIGPAAPADVLEGAGEAPWLARRRAGLPSAMPLQEDDLLAVVAAFDEPVTAEALRQRAHLIPLLAAAL